MKHRKTHKVRRGSRRRSAAQKAATRKLVALMKAKRAHKVSRKSRPAKRHRRTAHRRASHKPSIKAGLSVGKHRPVVHVRAGGKLARPKRSRIRPHARFVNPFLGELAVLGGNPRRKRRHTMKSMSLLRNPIKGTLAALTQGPKEMVKVEFLKDAVAVAGGFVLPNMVISKLPASLRDSQWKVYACKVATVSLLAGVSGMVSKRVQKAVLLGGGISILLDLYADFVAPRIAGVAAPAAPAGTSTYFGMDAYYGGHDGVGESVVDGVGDLAETF